MSVPSPFISADSWDTTLEKAKKARTTKTVPEEESGKEPKAEDLELDGPLKIDETLELDPIYEVDLPLPVRVERPFATYESSYSFEQGHLHTRRTLQISQDKLSPERWQELESFAKLIERDLDQDLTLRRTGSVDLLSQADEMTADELNSAAASLLSDRKDYSLARDLLLKATAKDPQHKWAWNNLGRAYATLGSFAEAERAYKKQLEINPNDEYTYKNLGLLYSMQKRSEAAVAALRKHIEINPFDKDVYNYLASTLARMKRWDEAAQAYEKSAAVNRDKPDIYTYWGGALLRAGKAEDGRKQLERALEMDSSAHTLNNVAYLLAEVGVDLEKAEQRAKRAVEVAAQPLAGPLSLDPSPNYSRKLFTLGAYLDTLGWVYFQQGNPKQAEPVLHAAYQLQPTSTVAEHLAQTYMRLDRYEEALRYLAYAPMSLGWAGRSRGELKDLEDYLVEKSGSPEKLATRIVEMRQTYGDHHLLGDPKVSFGWAAERDIKKPVFVEVIVLVDPTGAVTDARVFSDDERFRDVALADARNLRLPPLAWPGHSLPTVRTVLFHYLPPSMASPDYRLKVTWSLGKATVDDVAQTSSDGDAPTSMPARPESTMGLQRGPNVPSGQAAHPSLPKYLAAMENGRKLLLGRDVDGAVTNFRRAIQAEPNCTMCRRALADALVQRGDRAAAIAEYQEVTRLDPDNPEHHFMLGAQYEAGAATEAYAGYHYDAKTRTSRPRSAKPSKAAQMNMRPRSRSIAAPTSSRPATPPTRTLTHACKSSSRASSR